MNGGQALQLSLYLISSTRNRPMPPLKRLFRISFIVLFTVLLFNVVVYFVIRSSTQHLRLCEEGEHTSSSQQIYMQQIVGKIAALSIHHHFSEDQFANQLAYLRSATASFQNGQNTLRSTVGKLNVEKQTVLLQQSDSAYREIFRQASALIAHPQRNSDEWADAGSLYAASGAYLPRMQELYQLLRAQELEMESKIEWFNRGTIISLVLCLLYLIVLVIAPVFRQSARNYERLQKSLEELRRTDALLKESERKYRYLFEFNPMPMWIFDREDLRFLEVNQMAVQHYGYSVEEFDKMTILDIRPAADREKVMAVTHGERFPGAARQQGQWIHCKKNGQQIFVEVISHPIEYNGRPAILILAKDVTRNIELQNELLEEKIAHQREIARATVMVQEKERNEIGRELHDNVNQILTSVKLHLEFMGNDDMDLEKHRVSCLNRVALVIEEIRRLSRSLVPHTLNDIGLIPSILDLTENLNALGPVRFTFSTPSFDEDQLPPGIKLTLLRIIQEQTTNILKYAHASLASIELNLEDDNMALIVSDNGVGFDPSAQQKGIGLTNIMNRADIYHGQLKLDSAPGAGCRLEVRFSLKKVFALEHRSAAQRRAQA
ncbi:MAG: PAS domain S-box protein [Chitinophagaceae bacterium]|nr:MAG: PAS domain S-box protein [Chitinophagaceae bacterium]